MNKRISAHFISATILTINTVCFLISSLLFVLPSTALAQPYEARDETAPSIQFSDKKETQVDKTPINTLINGNLNDELFYAYAGDPTKMGLLFIHGTPGGWHAFETYLENPRLQKDFFMVSVDRLGWGKSGSPKQKLDGDFSAQSSAIIDVLNNYPTKQWIIVGHSLGASIAPQIALDYADRTKGLLLLAGSLNPSLGAPRWYNYAANTLLVSAFLSKSMRNSNREIMALRKELKKMDSKIKSTELPVHLSIMQGKSDLLVSPKNPDYAKQNWQNHFISTTVLELNEGHFLPWKQTPKVIELIYDLADKAN